MKIKTRTKSKKKVETLIKDENFNKKFDSFLTEMEQNTLVEKYNSQLKDILIFLGIYHNIEKIELKVEDNDKVSSTLFLNTDLEFYKKCVIRPIAVDNKRNLKIKLTIAIASFLAGYFRYIDRIQEEK